jgi:hypothetical protein
VQSKKSSIVEEKKKETSEEVEESPSWKATTSLVLQHGETRVSFHFSLSNLFC